MQTRLDYRRRPSRLPEDGWCSTTEYGIRLRVVCIDLENPERCLLRGDSWIFGPEAEYERHGDVDDVVFPCGYTMDADGDTLNIYYGAADCAIALARASVRALLEWLDANGSCERRRE
jgi:predicted GH43/DUF377 family glycosyl hydrolase